MAPVGSRFLVACVQMRATDDKDRNLEGAARWIADAAGRGARLVVLPEMFLWRGPPERDAEAAEPADGPSMRRIAELARRHELTIVAGSFLERVEGGLPFNTSLVFGPAGEALGAYRKMHLFDVAIPGRVEVRESSRMAPGGETSCVDTDVGRVGLSICYDLRFPELYRRLSRAGATLLCIPSAFTHPTGAAHWEILVRARAIENLAYVLAPDQIGPVEHGPPVWGGSSIVDPWGTVLASAPDHECAIVAEVDLEHLRAVRTALPCLEHARIEV